MLALVIDDSRAMRRVIMRILTQCGFDVIEAGDGQEALDALAASPTLPDVALDKLLQVAPDCVTMDVEMPGLDGIATVRELRKTHPRLPVVMFSTLTERSATATLDALAAGASDYVCKPANVGSVPEAMQSV